MERLDKTLVERKLVASRTRAQALIKDGKVKVNGTFIDEPDHSVDANDLIEITENDQWVSRGALKLIAAFDHWKIDPKGMTVLDIGASTGGFTEVLLERGATKVYALDVGHDQLAEKLRNDERVVNMERVHIKDVKKADFGTLDLIVIDVSFISLTKVLSKVKELLLKGDVIALVKPQFEVGKKRINKGVVKDEKLRQEVLGSIIAYAEELGFVMEGQIDSPVEGGDGNKEFLVYLRAS